MMISGSLSKSHHIRSSKDADQKPVYDRLKYNTELRCTLRGQSPQSGLRIIFLLLIRVSKCLKRAEK